jgi:hypothetical protein
MSLRSTTPLSASMSRESAEALSGVFIKTADTLGDEPSPINETITRERLLRVSALASAYAAGGEPHPAIAATLDWYDAVVGLSNLTTWLEEDREEVEGYRKDLEEEGRIAPALDQGPLREALAVVDPDRLAEAWRGYAAQRLEIIELWRAPELERLKEAREALSRFEELRAELDEETIATLEASFATAIAANEEYRSLLERSTAQDRALGENARGAPEYWHRLFSCISFDLGALLPDQAMS